MDVCRSLADTFFTHRLCECRRTMLFSMFSELQHDYDYLEFMGSNVIFDGILALCEHYDTKSSTNPASSIASQIYRYIE